MTAIETKFLKAFVSGTIETLRTQCHVTATAGKAFVRGASKECATDIASIIALQASDFYGSFALVFPQATYLKVMSEMFGETFMAIDKDLKDGAGELINMAFGQAKTELNALGHNLELARPSVVQDQTHVRHLSDAPVIIVPFVAEKLAFQVELAIEKAA